MHGFMDMLELARENVRSNPSVVNNSTEDVYHSYLQALKDEAEEVTAEVKEDNSVYLTDELSDIAWDYAMILALLESRGYILSAEEVLTHGFNKYYERTPALRESSSEMWQAIKKTQKEELKKRHEEKHGSTD
jgi:NTP pyrophosphatase (non-canonical NTP hydrolase)